MFYRTIQAKKKIAINDFISKYRFLMLDHRFTGHPEYRKLIFHSLTRRLIQPIHTQDDFQNIHV